MKKVKIKSKNKKIKLNRMLKIFATSIIVFVEIGVWYKLLFKQNDWLYISLVWAVAYGLGLVIKRFVYSQEKAEITNRNLFIGGIVAVATISAFVSGIILDSTRWFAYLCSAAIPYVISILVGHDFYNPEDEQRENNTISEVKII